MIATIIKATWGGSATLCEELYWMVILGLYRLVREGVDRSRFLEFLGRRVGVWRCLSVSRMASQTDTEAVLAPLRKAVHEQVSGRVATAYVASSYL